MSRKVFPIVSAAIIVVAVVAGGVLARAAGADGSHNSSNARASRQYVGYWFGIDPLDGGDSRRAITAADDGGFSLIGRDTVFTLCDNTDRAVITADLAASGTSLTSRNLVIACTNTGDTVRLNVRYDPIAENIIRERVASADGSFTDEIIFHRVSA
jgi:hypothetical protein